jgi:hypothetical protein
MKWEHNLPIHKNRWKNILHYNFLLPFQYMIDCWKGLDPTTFGIFCLILDQLTRCFLFTASISSHKSTFFHADNFLWTIFQCFYETLFFAGRDLSVFRLFPHHSTAEARRLPSFLSPCQNGSIFYHRRPSCFQQRYLHRRVTQPKF